MLFTFNRIMDIKLFSSFTLCFKETTVEDINSATKKKCCKELVVCISQRIYRIRKLSRQNYRILQNLNYENSTLKIKQKSSVKNHLDLQDGNKYFDFQRDDNLFEI